MRKSATTLLLDESLKKIELTVEDLENYADKKLLRYLVRERTVNWNG